MSKVAMFLALKSRQLYCMYIRCIKTKLLNKDPIWILIRNNGFIRDLNIYKKVLYCSVVDPNKLNLEPEFSPNLVNGKKNLSAWKEDS